jgi:CHASE3 domain sensor protein
MAFSIEAKLWISFILVTLIISIMGIVSYKNSQKIIATSQWVAHTHEALVQLTILL